MDSLFIESTPVTPEVHFNPETAIFEIKGISMPEYADEFYKQLLDYIHEYLATTANETTTLIFKFNYFNTGTSPAVEAILKAFEKNKPEKHEVKVKWYYETEDEDMKDLGEHYQNMTSLPVEIIASDETFYSPPEDASTE
ncbi:MAG: DUF1987 domain-containing protein [Microscillaceae bacterium]|nr:DUF1987 domain-containing protein [Microscillaceae bacterium]MDW8459631.1 DUF1987 domain-containing protein [Cytophagales bacterium]